MRNIWVNELLARDERNEEAKESSLSRLRVEKGRDSKGRGARDLTTEFSLGRNNGLKPETSDRADSSVIMAFPRALLKCESRDGVLSTSTLKPGVLHLRIVFR